MTATRQLLLDRAREMFNEHGLDSVGVRDLARDLDLSPGNVSYYFPRKEDLVAELMSELRERNARNVDAVTAASSLPELLDRYRETFRAQYDYRFIPRALLHIIDTYPALGRRYTEVDGKRREGLTRAFTAMVGTDIDPDATPAAIARVVATCTITARFWLSEMRLSYDGHLPESVIDHYLAIIAHAVWALATPSTKQQLASYLDGVIAASSHRPNSR
jgi:AcrR family transcriptional regulator